MIPRVARAQSRGRLRLKQRAAHLKAQEEDNPIDKAEQLLKKQNARQRASLKGAAKFCIFWMCDEPAGQRKDSALNARAQAGWTGTFLGHARSRNRIAREAQD